MFNNLFTLFTAIFDLYSNVQLAIEARELSQQDPETLERSLNSCTYLDSLLHHVASDGNLALLKAILRKRPDLLNHANKDNRTPILWAAKYGHKDVVKYLISLGADLNLASHPEVEYMTELGAGLEVTYSQDPKYRKTALQCAVENNHSEVVLLLIQAGAIPNKYSLQHKNFLTILHRAAIEGDLNAIEIILSKHPDLCNQVDEQNQSLLWHAINNKHYEIVLFLLKAGATINDHVISNKNCDDVLRESNVTEALANTPELLAKSLCNAASRDGESEIRYLVSLGADLNQPDKWHNTPLCCAARSGHTSMVELLISLGAKLDQIGNENGTPLYCAAKYKRIEIIKLLTKSGADLNKAPYYPSLERIMYEKTPLHVSVRQPFPDVEQILFLIQNGATIDNHLIESAKFHNLLRHPIIAEAVSNNRDLFIELIDDRYNILHVMAQRGYIYTIQLILKNHPDLLNQTDADNQTPLLWAAKYGQKDTVKYLLSLDANFSQATHDLDTDTPGKTPLQWAINNNHTEIAEMIAAADAQSTSNQYRMFSAKSNPSIEREASENDTNNDDLAP